MKQLSIHPNNVFIKIYAHNPWLQLCVESKFESLYYNKIYIYQRIVKQMTEKRFNVIDFIETEIKKQLNVTGIELMNYKTTFEIKLK